MTNQNSALCVCYKNPILNPIFRMKCAYVHFKFQYPHLNWQLFFPSIVKKMFIIELVANISIDNKMRKIKIVVVALELKIKMVIFTIYYVCQSNRNMFYKATSRN